MRVHLMCAGRVTTTLAVAGRDESLLGSGSGHLWSALTTAQAVSVPAGGALMRKFAVVLATRRFQASGTLNSWELPNTLAGPAPVPDDTNRSTRTLGYCGCAGGGPTRA